MARISVGYGEQRKPEGVKCVSPSGREVGLPGGTMSANPQSKIITSKEAINSTREHLERFRNTNTRTWLDDKKPHLDIRIFPHSIDRALKLAEEFLSGASRMGCTIYEGEKQTYWNTDTPTGKILPIYIQCRGQSIQFELTERATQKMVKHLYRGSALEFTPTGFLTFKYNGFGLGKNTWRETSTRRIEDHLSDILAEIEPITDLLERYEKAREEHLMLMKERDQFMAIQEELMEVAEANRQAFYKSFRQWERLERQDEFIKAMELLHSVEANKNFGSWLCAAKRHLDNRRLSIRPWETFRGTTFDPADIKTDVLPDLE